MSHSSFYREPVKVILRTIFYRDLPKGNLQNLTGISSSRDHLEWTPYFLILPTFPFRILAAHCLGSLAWIMRIDSYRVIFGIFSTFSSLAWTRFILLRQMWGITGISPKEVALRVLKRHKATLYRRVTIFCGHSTAQSQSKKPSVA